MQNLLKDVHTEIVELHDVFVAWFNGSADKTSLEEQLNQRFPKNMLYMEPDGQMMPQGDLMALFDANYGSNPEFNIEISNVQIRHQFDDHILATYTERQTGSNFSSAKNNLRSTSLLLKKSDPFEWLHIHETWLPKTSEQSI